MKKYFLVILLVFWLLVIFLFSNQTASKSQSTSDKVASDIVDVVETVTKNEIKKDKKENIIENTRFLVRKTAHFTLYFILGIIVYLLFNSYGVKKILFYSILFCFLYACSDEIHQLFLDGRTAKVLDICIDTCGSSLAIISLFYLHEFQKKYHENIKYVKKSEYTQSI